MLNLFCVFASMKPPSGEGSPSPFSRGAVLSSAPEDFPEKENPAEKEKTACYILISKYNKSKWNS